MEATAPSTNLPSSLAYLLTVPANHGSWPRSGTYPCLLLFTYANLSREQLCFPRKADVCREEDRSLYHQYGGMSRLRFTVSGGLPHFSLNSPLPVSDECRRLGQGLLLGRHLVFRLLVCMNTNVFGFFHLHIFSSLNICWLVYKDLKTEVFRQSL